MSTCGDLLVPKIKINAPIQPNKTNTSLNAELKSIRTIWLVFIAKTNMTSTKSFQITDQFSFQTKQQKLKKNLH